MVVELLSVGSEILLGNIVNTNAQYLAAQCAGLGFSVFNQTVVGDNFQRLALAFETALSRADIVIATGGLGPTSDDITKEALAALLNKKLIRDPFSQSRIEDWFAGRHKGKMPATNLKQADVIEGAVVLSNENGTAPGLIVEEGKKIIVLLPGPPDEMTEMFETKVIEYLKKLSDTKISSVFIRLIGLGESMAAEKISDLTEMNNPTVATYAKEGEVMIRITVMAKSQAEADLLLEPVLQEVKNRFEDYIFAENSLTSIEEIIVERLKEKHLTISTAESCTGGLLSARFINVPGVSEVYKEGVITYSNEAKVKRLGVPVEILEKFGAVSIETAKAMSEGCQKAANSDMAIAITGIAGPDGGSEEKPAGLVYIACTFFEETVVERFLFKGNRKKVRDSAVIMSMALIQKMLNQTENQIK